MLKIFNDLKPFFENNYKRINVREYSRIRGISPPSASKLLNELEKETLLNKEKERNYIFYSANKESKLFLELSKTYIFLKFQEIKLIDYFEKELINPHVVLFGSFSKAEINENSDIDLAIFASSKKSIDLNEFEKKLKRKIQLFIFTDQNDIKNRDLMKSIFNGFNLLRSW